jgi:hypothetical protein
MSRGVANQHAELQNGGVQEGSDGVQKRKA